MGYAARAVVSGALGVITECTVTYLRVGGATAILNPALAWALLGLTDVHALTIAITKAHTEVGRAALAMAVGCVPNTVVKSGTSLVEGRGEFRGSAAFGFVALLVGSGMGIVLGR